MHISIVCGSHRPGSQSLKVSEWLRDTLLGQQLADQAEIINLAGNPLPLWDQGVWENDPTWQALLSPIHATLRASSGLILVTPEWHGQVPAGLKNLLLLLGKAEVGHKPALIVSLSSGVGGACPVAELRMSGYKNNRICYLPEHLIIRNVGRVLNADPTLNHPEEDDYLRRRITWTLKLLRAYAEALEPLRQHSWIHSADFPFGMS